MTVTSAPGALGQPIENRDLAGRRDPRGGYTGRVHVTVTTTKGSPDQPREVARLAGEEMVPWLEGIQGFEGLLMLSDEATGRTLVVTFWESRELADRHLAARAAFRDRITSTVDAEVEDVSDYELTFGSWPAGAPE